MKNVFFWIITLITSLSAVAQTQPPQAFNYQGIARDVSGSPLASRNISLRLSILQGDLRSLVYQETHDVTTNKLGIFTTEVGHGSSQLGLLQDLEWGIADHYIQVELDPDGGTNYTLLGESQLLSVPYALYAGNASSGEDYWQSNDRGIHYNDGNVGIGTDRPDARLTVQGNDPVGNDRMYLDLNNQSTSNRSLVWVNLSAGEQNSATSLQHFAETYDFDGDKYTDFGILASSGRGIILRADDPGGVIKFMAGGSIQSSPERMRIDELGNVGIGTQNPSTRVQVAGGDVYIQDINNGVIMKSPNGGCWRLTVNNDGSIKTTVITCPD